MIYSIYVTAGLENIACQELTKRFGDTEQFKIRLRKPKRIVFQYSGNPKDLLSLRTAEQLFLVVKYFPNINRSRGSLATIKNSLKHINLNNVLASCRRVGINIHKRISFRVMSRMSGFRNFQKRDLQQTVERGLIDRGWYLTGSNTGLDVFVEVHGQDAYLSIKLSKVELAQRSDKHKRLPQSIKPTLAYSMVWLSQPNEKDIVLDPMCGSGTILLERAFAGRYRYLIGGDISEEAIITTQRNFGRQHQPRQFFQWDAYNVPLQPNSIDKILCNLPIADKNKDLSQLSNLYKKLLLQCETVLKQRGKIVLMTYHFSLLEKILKQEKALKITQKVSVGDGGRRGRIYVIRKI